MPEELQQRHRDGLERFWSGQASAEPVAAEALAKNGTRIPVEITFAVPKFQEERLIVAVLRDTRQRQRLGLYESILPVCCMCGAIRDDTGVEHGKGHWDSLEEYVRQHSRTQFSHTYCPKCYADALVRFGLEAK
jgi:hypothetical protein